jgi:hypothetical protein
MLRQAPAYMVKWCAPTAPARANCANDGTRQVSDKVGRATPGDSDRDGK